jgi:hypothetical protein
MFTAIAGLAGLYIYPETKSNSEENNLKKSDNKSHNRNINTVNVNLTQPDTNRSEEKPTSNLINKHEIISLMKERMSILFVDDDKKFQMVKIIKNSEWKKVKSVTDIKSLDERLVVDAQIIFVDIHGVGLKLNCENEGLDLALMLKKKYPLKTIVLYSANSQHDVFHEALSIVDHKLKKNATPFEFQNLIEKTSLSYYENSNSLPL